MVRVVSGSDVCFQALTDGSASTAHSDVAPSLSPSDSSPNSKRKRNSYSDSPHKLQCPYCPRAFPWVSSLKRHILTHTGRHHAMRDVSVPATR